MSRYGSGHKLLQCYECGKTILNSQAYSGQFLFRHKGQVCYACFLKAKKAVYGTDQKEPADV